MASQTRRLFQFGPFQLDASDRLLCRDGETVALPPKVLDTLLLLVASHGHVLTREEMVKQLWPNTFVEDGTLTQYISLLRKALGDLGNVIESIPRRGYRFTAPVMEIEASSAAPPVGQTPATVAEVQKVVGSRKRFYFVPSVVATSAVLLAGVLSLLALTWMRRTDQSSRTFSSVAVLPFRCISKAGSDYACDGITDALITRLANVQGLRVVSYSRVRRFKGSPLDAAEIGQQLGVEAVIEGTIRSAAGQIRLSVHAIDTDTADTVWADDRFEGTPAGLLRMERQLAEAVALRLRPRLTSTEQSRLGRTVTRSAGAYDLVLRARSMISKRRTPADLQSTLRLLERATELDPAYADAYAWLSFAQNALYHVEGPAILRSAISNANRALSLNPNSLVAMHALVQISHLTGRGVEALLMAHRALEQNPEDLDATAGAALAYFRVGLIDRAVPLYQKALAAEPDNAEFLHQLARCYLYLGEYRKGIDTLAPLPLDQRGMFGMLLYAKAGQVDHARHSVRANLQRDPNNPSAAYFAGWVLLYGGDIRSAAQVWYEAARRTERRLADQENLHHRMWLGLMYAQLGQTERALAQARNALAADPQHPWSLYFTARIYGLLGNRQEALNHLKAAIDNGFLMLPYVELELWRKMGFYMLRNDPDFLALHAGLARRIAELRERY